MLKLHAIASVDRNWAIGNNGKLLIRNRDDMKLFQDVTTNQVVIMGRTTLQSLPGGKPLRNRRNIVLTSRKLKTRNELTIVHSVEAAIRAAEQLSRSGHAWVIGGTSIYRQLLPYCTTSLITKHQCAHPADAHFPNLDRLPNWRCNYYTCERRIPNGEPDAGVKYRFVTYINDQPLALPA